MLYALENSIYTLYENGYTLFIVWIFTILTATAVTIGVHLYISVKKRFDEEYKAGKILWRRIIHGIVYFIFVVLAYEAVTIRFKGEIARIALFFIYLCLFIFALFIFGDILISIRKIVRK
ncbi:MAG: hypothetical protein DRJ38_04570 [Thermoprotei archaeon]|nr:MAG: hypothetical protein DRJ38_04570 [Thermoprotei archaeon]